MNALQILRDDHKKILGLFEQFEAVLLRTPEMKDGVAREIFMELEIHSTVERELVYPELASGDEALRGLVSGSLEAHEAVDEQVSALKKGTLGTEGFDDEMRELISNVQDHVYEEERELFPRAERQLGAKLEELGDRIEFRKLELRERPEFREALPERVQNPSGGEQKRVKKPGQAA